MQFMQGGDYSMRHQSETPGIDSARRERYVIHVRPLRQSERKRLAAFFTATEQVALALANELDPDRGKPHGVVAKLDSISLAARQGALLLRRRSDGSPRRSAKPRSHRQK